MDYDNSKRTKFVRSEMSDERRGMEVGEDKRLASVLQKCKKGSSRR
jgi:hypothetical protein